MGHTYRRGRALLTSVLVASCLTGCGPVEPDQVTPDRFVDPPVISSAAAQSYGDRAEEAFGQVADFLLDHSYVLPLVDPRHTAPTADQLSDGIVEVLTADAAKEWRALVDKDLAGDEAARDDVRLLRFHSWQTEDADLASPQDPVRFQTVTEGEVDLGTLPGDSTQKALVVSLVHRADVRLAEARVPYDVVLTKPLTFTLVPDPDDPDRWLIADFEGTMQVEVDGELLDDSASTSG